MVPSDAQSNDAGRATDVVGRAAGVSDAGQVWFIAVVLNNTELSSARKLADMGYESFVPSRTQIVTWKDGRRKKREKVLIPSAVFIHCTEKERLEVVRKSFVKYFLVDRARNKVNGTKSPIAVVPDVQIKKLKFLLERDSQGVYIEPLSVRVGDQIRVMRGPLAGFEGEICYCNGVKKVGALIDGLGYACVDISVQDLEIIKDGQKK